MAPVAVREPLVFTVRLLAAPLVDPVTVATEMISLPPSAKVMVTPEFSTNEPGLLMDAEAPDELTLRLLVAVTIWPRLPRVTLPPATMFPARLIPPVPETCTAPVEVMPTREVMPEVELTEMAPPLREPLTVTPVDPSRVMGPLAVVALIKLMADAVARLMAPPAWVVRFWKLARPVPPVTVILPVVVMSFETAIVPGEPKNTRLLRGVFAPTRPDRVLLEDPFKVRSKLPSSAPTRLMVGARIVLLAASVVSVASCTLVPAVRLPPKVTRPMPVWEMLPREAANVPEVVRVPALLTVILLPAVNAARLAVLELEVRLKLPLIWLVAPTVTLEPERVRLSR